MTPRRSRFAVLTAAAVLAVALAAAAGDPIVPLSAEVYPTIHSLSVIAYYAGDDDQDATAHVEYRRAGDPDWRRGHDLAALAGNRFAGSVLFLDAATGYDVRLVLEDPDNPGEEVLEAAATTRLDSPQPAPSGRDWWVDAALGSDANPGTAGAPLATIQTAAGLVRAGEVVRVRPGVYREAVTIAGGGGEDGLVWYRAEGDGVVVDGADAAIEAGVPWTAAGGPLYYTPFGGKSAYLAIDDDRLYEYPTLASLQAEDGNIGQPGVLPGGFFVDKPAARLYVIAPDHASPAGRAVHVAVRGPGFTVARGVSGVVIEGFELRYLGVAGNPYALVHAGGQRVWLRRNRIHHVSGGVYLPDEGLGEDVIEGNSFRDTSVYGWPWATVKGKAVSATAVKLRSSGNIVRRNQVEGSFNGLYVGSWDDRYDEDIAHDNDLYENCLRYHGDDGLEIEGTVRNGRLWDNLVRDTFVAVSTSPVTRGPAFVAFNLLRGYQDHALKINNQSDGWVFLYHNTAYPLDLAAYPKAQALEPDLFGGVRSRNNIWEANRYVIEYEPATTKPGLSLDHDDLFTHDPGLGNPCSSPAPAIRFVKWQNLCYPDLPALVASGTIEAGGFQVEPGYEDAAGGDFTLLAGHPLVDAGVPLAGINDRRTAGAGPDLGAVERGLDLAAADLVETGLVAPRYASAGASLVAADTVTNAGNRDAAASRTRLFLSGDMLLDPGDAPLGDRGVPALPPLASASGSIAFTVPPGVAPGTYHLLAAADADQEVAETSEGNNTLAHLLGIGPDLVVTSVVAPAAGGADLPLTVADTISNRAVDPAGSSSTSLFLSADPVLDGADIRLGERAIRPLPGGDIDSGVSQVGLPPGVAAGTWYVLAAADGAGVIAEASETNNATASAAVAIGPDLTVSQLVVPAAGGAGLPLAVTDTTANLGGGGAPASTTSFYLSINAAYDAGDVAIGTRLVPALAPGQTSTAGASLTVPAGTPVGSYYVLALGDGPGLVAETAEGNNLSSARVVIGPDLVVATLSAPASGGAGRAITVSDGTRNQGGGNAAASTTSVYLSTDATYGAGDVLLGSRPVPLLGPGVTRTGSTAVTIPPGTAAGVWYLVAVADAGGVVSETLESNNQRSKSIKIGPDLQVSALTAPGTAPSGGSVIVSDTTRNIGGGDAPASTTRIYFSTNATLDASDLPLGGRTVAPIVPGGLSAGATAVTLPVKPPGKYYLIAAADGDGVVAEINEANNLKNRAITLY